MLSDTHVKKINRQKALEKYPKFPQGDFVNGDFVDVSPDTYAGYILTLKSKSIKEHVRLLSSELITLLKALGYDSVLFLGKYNNSWRQQDNAYKPVKEALKFLENNKLGKKFNGALEVHAASLNQFIKHLFWLTRCNAGFPDMHFLDKGQNILGQICQYGNIHIYSINKEADKLLNIEIDKTKFSRLVDTVCHEPFSKTGAIKGRQFTLSKHSG